MRSSRRARPHDERGRFISRDFESMVEDLRIAILESFREMKAREREIKARERETKARERAARRAAGDRVMRRFRRAMRARGRMLAR